ncbi:hypothetical protein SAY86_002279 [Trapa natans]|uniref:NPH3 domain-containing protein n=1 Tax=Trapa natans TaxID=22666 RepID=A0AAN7LQR4_TRANT|nr:hypothetical protein SAY86_002279 [Trapa natans]
MKFMKLGSRPDTFFTSEAITSVASEVSCDLIIQVNDSKYLLHKFPLLSKCLRLKGLCHESPDHSSDHDKPMVQLPDFPGGAEAFELCAKFCYSITITLSAQNIVAARCAAEYLHMSEDVEKGNLIYKLEVFFNSCILRGWRDCIVTLQTTRKHPLWSYDLGITSGCIDSIASKVSLSHSQSRRAQDYASCSRTESLRHSSKFSSKSNWWADDLAELGIDLYWRAMIAVKSDRRVPSKLIADALKIYASRWLPNISPAHKSGEGQNKEVKHRVLLESIISLLPSEKEAVSCGFLLKLLKASSILNASPSTKTELARRVALQLQEASANDLLIPNPLANSTIYDVDTVMSILEQFMVQGQSPPISPPRSKLRVERRRRSRSTENIDAEFHESRRSSSVSHSFKLKVARIMDKYLQEIAGDVNLPLSKFIAVAEAVPDFARSDHDDLYRAIDIYLKAHQNLNKTERKRLCRILDCKKLSMESCIHAAQNEMLPLRVVVQVLFFEQARAAMSCGKMVDLPANIKALLATHGLDPWRPSGLLSTTASVHAAEDQWSVPKMPTLRMKLSEDNDAEEDPTMRNLPKRMLSRLWSINRTELSTRRADK